MGAFLSRAASRAATTVDEEVTFCSMLASFRAPTGTTTYDGRNGELLLLGVAEEGLDIITDDHPGFPLEHALGHDGRVLY